MLHTVVLPECDTDVMSVKFEPTTSRLSALYIAAVPSYMVDLLLFILWVCIVVIAALVCDLSCLLKALLLSASFSEE